MSRKQTDTSPAIEGYFRRTRSRRSAKRKFVILLLAGLVLVATSARLQPMLLLPAATLLVLAALALAYSVRTRRIRVRLDNAFFTVSGDGYDIRLSAPFRRKTGVERTMPADRGPETCFIRMVIDVHGKPLVFEEQVQTGYIPPPLDEITGIASALGMAELTSLTPYPGPLWALIEQMRRLEIPTGRVKADEAILALKRMGERQLRNKQYIEAIDTYSTIVRRAPESADAYFGRGSARYFARRDLDKAVNDLTTTLRLDPERNEVYRMRALARAAQGDWTSLRDDCSAALQFLTPSAEFYNLRGTASYRLEDYDGAMTDFEAAIKLEPRRPESYYNRGLARQRAGRSRLALADFKHALLLNPEFEAAARSLEAMQRQTGRQINSES